MEIRIRIAAAGLETAYLMSGKDPAEPPPHGIGGRFAGDAFAPQRGYTVSASNDPGETTGIASPFLSLGRILTRSEQEDLYEFPAQRELHRLGEAGEGREKYNCNIPWAILMDPTSACNLHCTGCWAAEYGNKLNLSLRSWTASSARARAGHLHVHLFRRRAAWCKDDILRSRPTRDCVFLAFTNATLIDEAFADEIMRVRNFVPAISVEGFEEETACRARAPSTAVMGAMDPAREPAALWRLLLLHPRQRRDHRQRGLLRQDDRVGAPSSPGSLPICPWARTPCPT